MFRYIAHYQNIVEQLVGVIDGTLFTKANDIKQLKELFSKKSSDLPRYFDGYSNGNKFPKPINFTVPELDLCPKTFSKNVLDEIGSSELNKPECTIENSETKKDQTNKFTFPNTKPRTKVIESSNNFASANQQNVDSFSFLKNNPVSTTNSLNQK